MRHAEYRCRRCGVEWVGGDTAGLPSHGERHQCYDNGRGVVDEIGLGPDDRVTDFKPSPTCKFCCEVKSLSDAREAPSGTLTGEEE